MNNNDERIVKIVEAFKGVFTEEELKKMEKDYEEWKTKTLEEKSKEVEMAYSRSIENQNYFDY